MESFRATIILHRGANLYKLVRADSITAAMDQTRDYIGMMIGADAVRKVSVELITPHELPAVAQIREAGAMLAQAIAH